ncbi:MAG: hypothetical protein AB8G22_14850, partial [Saprospiraceae bacterium]
MKELILRIKGFVIEVLRNWYIIALIAVPVLIFNLWQVFQTHPRYTANLTFMLNDDDGGAGGIGGISSILGQFGFGGGKGGKFNLEKIVQLSKSRRIIQESIFEKITINNKLDYVANHIIDIYDYHEIWKEDTTGLADFKFVDDSLSTFGRRDNKVLKKIHKELIGGEEVKGLIACSIDESTGILTLKASTRNEQLSIQLSKILYENLSSFFVKKSIEGQTFTYDIIKFKTDSLQNALSNAQTRLLRFQDSNRGLTLQRYEAERIRIQQEIQKLIIAYGESYKQLEIADFSLRSSTPFV